MKSPYPVPLQELTRASVARLESRLRRHAPALARSAGGWMRSLAGDNEPARYFLHPRAFPAVLLPWLAEEAIRRRPSRSFQGDVAYSTVAGYYFVRLVDDLMDGEAVAPALVPLLIVLHSEFEQAYHRHFPAGHPFWDALNRGAYQAAETASRDAREQRIARKHFLATSARKVAGAKIPLAAVCHRYDRADLLQPWSAFVDALGRWHQMLNDMLGWSRDLQRGTATYFLSEAAAHAGSGGIAEWVIGDGYRWGMHELGGWMSELQAQAAALDSPQLVSYLEGRERAVEAAWNELSSAMAPLQRLATSLR